MKYKIELEYDLFKSILFVLLPLVVALLAILMSLKGTGNIIDEENFKLVILIITMCMIVTLIIFVVKYWQLQKRLKN